MGRNRTTGGTTLLLLIWFVWEVHRPDKKQLFPRTNYPNSRWAVQNVQCSGECLSLYVRKATQPLQKHVAQCSKARKDSAAHLHLKEKGHENRWQRGKGDIFVQCKRPSVNSVVVRMTPISSHYCPVLWLLPKQLNLPLHFDPCDLTDWHDDSICHWLSALPPRWQPHLGLKTWVCPSAARTEEEVKHLFESEKEEESST